MWDIMFFVTSILLGFGLAMDAFSVSLANGLNEPTMKKIKVVEISSVFAIFQGIMPLIGWICVQTILKYFEVFEKFIPWIAFALLFYIGGSMIIENLKNNQDEEHKAILGVSGLLVQGVATSIDALSVGFTIAEYDVYHAIVSSLIICVLTFGICFGGVLIGKKFGTKISGKANIIGGIILILIGLEIFITGIM